MAWIIRTHNTWNLIILVEPRESDELCSSRSHGELTRETRTLFFSPEIENDFAYTKMSRKKPARATIATDKRSKYIKIFATLSSSTIQKPQPLFRPVSFPALKMRAENIPVTMMNDFVESSFCDTFQSFQECRPSNSSLANGNEEAALSLVDVCEDISLAHSKPLNLRLRCPSFSSLSRTTYSEKETSKWTTRRGSGKL